MIYKDTFKYLITEFQNRKIPEIFQRELKIDEISKIISIIGFRRSGKTFFFYQLINSLIQNGIHKKNILYINFEDDRLFGLKVTDLQLIIDALYELNPDSINEQKFFFLDEIQVVDNWEKFVRRIYDNENIKLFITGSSSKLLSKEIATSLRGRTLTYNIFTLSFKEFLVFKNVVLEKNYEFSNQRYDIIHKLDFFINDGSFPEVVLFNHLKTKILQNYFDLFMYRDLVERYNIRNLLALKYLINYLLSNIGNLFSINKYHKTISSDYKISIPTIMEYFAYLEEILLIYPLKIFNYSVKVQQVNPVKIYCIDTGLRNVVAFKFSKDFGRLVENIICIELLRREKEIFYWKGRNEVDFIVKEKDNTLQGINVSYTDKINEREVLGLIEIQEKFKGKVSKLLLLTKDILKVEEGINYVPVWKWLLDS